MTAPRYQSKEDIVRDLTHVLNAHLSPATKYAVVHYAAWKWTEFDGKYHCPYWTEKALSQKPNVGSTDKELSKHFRHEHAVPIKVVWEMLSVLRSPTQEQVEEICESFMIGVIVTLLENSELNGRYRQTMPPEFSNPEGDKFHDKWLRYKLNGITVIPCGPNLAQGSPVTRKTPVGERVYRAVLSPNGEAIARYFKGKQRQTTYDSLIRFPEGATAKTLATDIGDKLVAKAGVEASVVWHLRHLELMGIAEVLDPIIEGVVHKSLK
jgi:hypothetical protein